MRGYAKFLNIIALIVFVLMILATLAVGASTAIIFMKPDLIESAVVEEVAGITVNGQPITVEAFAAFRTPFLVILGCMTVLLFLTLFIIGSIRSALKEVANETPFSIKCSKALHTAAILVVIEGIAAIAMNVYGAFALSGMAFNSAAGIPSTTNFTASLSFILSAALLQMLSKISEFGRR